MTDNERQAMRAALGALYRSAAELLVLWEAVAAKQRVRRVVDRQAFGQRVGVLVLGPADAEVMASQIVLTYGSNVVDVADVINYNLSTHVLSTGDDDGGESVA